MSELETANSRGVQDRTKRNFPERERFTKSPGHPANKRWKAAKNRCLKEKWTEPGSNRRHMDFQSIALPTELSVPQRTLS